MSRNTVSVALTTLIFLLPQFIASPATQATERVRIAVAEAFEPYIIRRGDDWSGIDIEINRELLRRLDMTPDYVPLPWARQLAYAGTGQAGALLTVYCEDERDYLEIVASPFYTVNVALFRHKDSTNRITKLDDAADHTTVGIVRENFFDKHFINNEKVNPVFSHSTPNLIAQLLHRRVHFVLEEDLLFSYYARQIDTHRQLEEVTKLRSYDVCAAFSKAFFKGQTGGLVERAVAHVDAMKAEGVIDRILARYTRATQAQQTP